MGMRTTLYAESKDVVAAFDQEGAIDFGEGKTLCLDKAAPILSYLIGADTGTKDLYYADCLNSGDVSFRSFSPDNVKVLLRRFSGDALSKTLTSVDWEAEIAGKIYPFAAQDKKSDSTSYILEYGAALQDFLEATALQDNGIMSVEC